ncbi:MAG: hypothetical protein VX822_01430 [Candidatus Neomarinimicrobiota bacterium]|nr:hypothetical protein [Candidatus Neomarinimicrobiota bacterium]
MKTEFESFLGAVSLVLVTGCVDMGSEPKQIPPEESPSFAKDIQPIFDISCALSGCHVSSVPRPPDLSEGKSYSEIVDIESPSFSPLKYIEPMKPGESVLYLKITGDQSTGSRMPPGGKLSEANMSAMRAWIEEGAEKN